jgi:hypothetical protein
MRKSPDHVSWNRDGYQPFPSDAAPFARSEIQIAFGQRFDPLKEIGPTTTSMK